MIVVRIFSMALIFLLHLKSSYADDRLIWKVTEKLHPHLVPFVFQLYSEEQYFNSHESYKTLKISTEDGSLIQEINHLPMGDSQQNLVFEDFNFDGMQDFRIRLENPVDDHYWVYDRHQLIFEKSIALSHIYCPQFDHQAKVIISSWKDKERQIRDYYNFEEFDLVLIKQEIISCDNPINCEKTILLDQEGVLAEVHSEKIQNNHSYTIEYLDSIIDKKAMCLVSMYDHTQQGERYLGIKNASLCLNTLAYELIPSFNRLEVGKAEYSLTLSLRNMLKEYYALIKMTTPCQAADDCELYQEELALLENIKFVDSFLTRMVSNIIDVKAPHQKHIWLAKWEGLNDMMYG